MCDNCLYQRMDLLWTIMYNVIKLAWRALAVFTVCGLIVAPGAQARADNPNPDPRFGAVEAYMYPEAAVELGLGWDRMIIHWHQRQPDSFRQWVTSRDEKIWVDQAEEEGREVVALLMGTPDWATAGLFGRGVPRGLYMPVNHPGNYWARFVRQVVSEHKGQIKHWVIWNEPDIASDHPGAQFDGTVHDYYRLLKVAYLTAKAVDPQAVIHMAALTFWHDVVYGRDPYLRRLLEVASQDNSATLHNYYFDILTLHIYFKTETVYELIALHRQMLAQGGLSQPIWLNETNAPPMDDPESPWLTPLFPVSLDQQASFVVQATALAFGTGAERVAVYKHRDATPPEPGYEPYGLFSYSGLPRPASMAYGEVIKHLSGFTNVRHSATTGYHLVAFENERGTTLVVWARNNAASAINLFSNTWDSVTVYDKYGDPQRSIPDEVGFYTLMLPPAECPESVGCVVGGDPYFVVEDEGSGGDLFVTSATSTVMAGDSWQRMVHRICIDELGWDMSLIEIAKLAEVNRSHNQGVVGDYLWEDEEVEIVCWYK